MGFPGRSVVMNFPANAENNAVLTPVLRRSTGEGSGNPLQYSCLESPMDKSLGGLQSMGLQRVGDNLVTKKQL